MRANELWKHIEEHGGHIVGDRIYPRDDMYIHGKYVWYVGRDCDGNFFVKLTDKDNIYHLNYSLYGTPEESLTYKLALANRRDFGTIEHITDKDYVVNSYHVDPRENIDAFKKLEIEGRYLALSSGGAVSYVETLDLSHNKKAILSIMRWMYEKILYAEFNRKIGVCYKCGYEGDIELLQTENGDFKFRCPHCGNEDDNEMNVTGRICGYLGQISSGNTNRGRLFDIFSRVLHLDCRDEVCS